MKLSNNFSSEEITLTPWEQIPKVKQFLMTNLVTNILQPILNTLGVSIKITSGERAQEDFARLKKSGYNPSITSDHNFGNPVSLLSTEPKYKMFGGLYSYSVGALDIVPAMNVLDACKKIMQMQRENKINCGQIIFERQLDGDEWIHISNPMTLMYSKEMIYSLNIGKKVFLQSLDNGKTYTDFKL